MLWSYKYRTLVIEHKKETQLIYCASLFYNNNPSGL